MVVWRWMLRPRRCSHGLRSWSDFAWFSRPSLRSPTGCGATVCRSRKGFFSWKNWRALSRAWWRRGRGGGGLAMALIECRHLTHVYLKGTPLEAVALQDVTLSIEAGEFVGLIGPTGSGKSTLIQHLNALLRPTGGEVRVAGINPADARADVKTLRQQVGLVFQYPEHQLFEETVYDDVAYGPRNLGLTEDKVRERVAESLALVGIDPGRFGRRSPFSLSGGEMRRVAIAGVLAMRPRVLVLDEPAAGLDPKGKEEILGQIRTLHQAQGLTVLLVAVFVVRDFSGYALLTLFLLAVVVASQIPLGYLLRGLRPILFLLLITVVLNVFFSGIQSGTVLFQLGPLVATREAVMRAAFVGYRLVALILVTSLLTFTTSPVQLTDGIERILRPFRRLGVPAHELAMMMTIALRFIPTLLEETEKIMKAQMARGAEFERGNVLRRARALVPVLVPLFVSAFRRADELALAMEARCYRGGEHRTRMKELHLAPRDGVALLLTFAVSAIFTIPYSTWQALLR